MPESTPTRDYSNLYIPGAIIIAGIIIGVSIIVAFGGGGAANGGAQQVAVDINDVNIEGDPYIGQPNAPVVLAYWSDYQCPFCKAVEVGHDQIPLNPVPLPEIIKNYVDTGKVKIVFKDYPFLGEDSITAALYEHAIWKLYPEKFYTWREAMFNAQDDEGDEGFGDEASIIALIKKIPGLDANALKTDVAANKDAYMERMNADKTEGTGFGVNGTPGFITGKTLLPGAVDYSQFKAAIDAQL